MTTASIDKYVIYGLYCLCHNEGIRYVGQSSLGASRRLSNHLGLARYWKEKGARLAYSQNWIIKHNYDIAYTILEVCLDAADLDRAEAVWIASLPNLTNIKPGGPQSRGWKMPKGHSVGKKNPIYGTKRPQYVIDAMQAGRKPVTPETRAKMRVSQTGRKHTPATLSKMSESQKRVKNTPEYLAGASERVSGEKNPMYGRRYTEDERHERSMAASTFTEDDIREIRRLKSEDGLLNREIGDMYGVDQSQISKIINRRRYGWIE